MKNCIVFYIFFCRSSSFAETVSPGQCSASSSFSRHRYSSGNNKNPNNFASICEEKDFFDNNEEELERLKTPLTNQVSSRTDRTDLDTNENDFDRDIEQSRST